MAAIQRSEFALALNQIASERGVDPAVVLETMKGAILAAYRKDNPIPDEEIDDYTVDLNENTGETSVLHKKENVTPPGFGRIAAQTAKQVLLQKIREKEKDAVILEYTKRIGTVVNGMILRFVGPNIILDVGKAEAMMEAVDKIPTEQYFINKKMPVYIRGIDEEKREIMVSRAHPGLIEGLLRREVPEVSSGSVTVKKVVREPGNRAKIAVYSEQSGIDPVGSCVGQKGVRIQAVIDALDGLEKIDVIQWSNDPVHLITNALSPAKNLTVEVNEKEKTAKVTAPREELPLIIGREGQNVRLASKLAEYNIEVEGIDAPVVETPAEVKPVETPAEVKPVETPAEIAPVEVPKEAKPLEPEVQAVEPEHVMIPEDAASEEKPVSGPPTEAPTEIAATDLVETPVADTDADMKVSEESEEKTAAAPIDSVEDTGTLRKSDSDASEPK